MCQFLFTYPIICIIQLAFFSEIELWSTYSPSGWIDLFQNNDVKVLVFIILYSIFVTLRPVVHHLGLKSMNIHNLLKIQILIFYLFYVVSNYYSSEVVITPVMQLVGYSITIFAYRGMIECVE